MSSSIRIAYLILITCLAAVAKSDAGEQAPGIIVFINRTPHELTFARGLTLTKAIVAVDGYAGFKHKATYLERHKTTRQIDLQAIIDGKAPDIVLEPWDVIIIGSNPSSHP